MAQDTINISDIFFGSTQSKYAGVALFMTILILCLILILMKWTEVKLKHLVWLQS